MTEHKWIFESAFLKHPGPRIRNFTAGYTRDFIRFSFYCTCHTRHSNGQRARARVHAAECRAQRPRQRRVPDRQPVRAGRGRELRPDHVQRPLRRFARAAVDVPRQQLPRRHSGSAVARRRRLMPRGDRRGARKSTRLVVAPAPRKRFFHDRDARKTHAARPSAQEDREEMEGAPCPTRLTWPTCPVRVSTPLRTRLRVSPDCRSARKFRSPRRRSSACYGWWPVCRF